MSKLNIYHHELRHNEYAEFYLKYEADKVITDLEDKIQMHDFFWEGCGFAKRGFKNSIAVSEAYDRLEQENAQLRARLAGKESGTAVPSATQRWMVASEPPQNMREVLICVPIRGHLAVCLGHYNYSKKQWFLHDRYDPTEVAYWSEKPYPPEK